MGNPYQNTKNRIAPTHLDLSTQFPHMQAGFFQANRMGEHTGVSIDIVVISPDAKHLCFTDTETQWGNVSGMYRCFALELIIAMAI